MLPKNMINNKSDTFNITSISQFNNLEKIKNYIKLKISL